MATFHRLYQLRRRRIMSTRRRILSSHRIPESSIHIVRASSRLDLDYSLDLARSSSESRRAVVTSPGFTIAKMVSPRSAKLPITSSRTFEPQPSLGVRKMHRNNHTRTPFQTLHASSTSKGSRFCHLICPISIGYSQSVTPSDSLSLHWSRSAISRPKCTEEADLKNQICLPRTASHQDPVP